ncbi:ATP-binding protein [Paraglaciecola aquimarina]|uniref:ATP-binding protein n=1 Tax=Paraglaciecola algarum TaxID=3050085 RepID=A0ABS9DBD9_9ALTE|nr:ATP-binding protein [Paraglaciecola sp. G1-23]MCF2950166.1 ATP-binding protein [Paraglaciecola sp. G1-23]
MYNFQERATGITDQSIKKRFNSIPAWKMISEYVWNGLDAGATSIEIFISDNELGGIESVEVHDNGDGIDFNNLHKNFDNFDDSSKKAVTQKGSQGRGRYSFHKFATKATWYTRNNNKDAIFEIHDTRLKDYRFATLTPEQQKTKIRKNGKGTSVYLTDIPKNKGAQIPEVNSLIKDLSIEHGWKLVLCSDIEIKVNGVSVTPPSNELHVHPIEIDGNHFNASIIRWDHKPNNEKSYNYFLDCNEVERHRALTSFNNKYNYKFFISGYISSDWFNDFQQSHMDNTDLFITESKSDSSSEFKTLSKQLRDISNTIYHDFLRSRANDLVANFESNGYFPQYQNESPDDRSFRLEHTKRVVVSLYIADPATFTNLKPKQIKILIALLDKLTVSSENDSLFDVLEGILELEKEQLDEFSSQIKKSKLDHIISTIGSLQKRDLVIQKMKYLFQEHNKDVLETPDLQGIIEANTWLFGAQYTTIGAEEDDFHKTAKALRDGDLEIADGDKIELSDLIEGADIEGAKGQVDLFLARKMPTVDHSTQEEFTRCTIIEIKRPSVALNKKHLGQVERYAEVLHKHPEFNDENMRFDVILVGTRLAQNDYQIKKRLKDNAGKNGQGLVSGADDRIRVYVKTWASIFNDFHITHSHLLQKLKINRSKLQYKNKDDLVNELQEKVD